MVPITVAILLVFLGSLWAFIHFRRRKNARELPPGPYFLPIIGNLHMLGNLPHRSLKKLALKYGPIMSIRLGNVLTIIVSSPYYAEQFLKTHDIIFASRPKVLAAEYLSYGSKAIAFTEYGPYWRNMRKLCTLELLTTLKIESFGPMRREEIGVKVEYVKRCAAKGEVVNVSAMLAELLEDMACRMIFGRCNDDRFDLKGAIHEAGKLAGEFNISEYVPWLGKFDLQGLNRRLKTTRKTLDKILETIIIEHEQYEAEHQSHHNDFTGLLLSLMSNHKNSTSEDSYTIDRTNVKAIMLDMVAASMDTSATASQWIFLNLMKHPRILKKLQAELENVVGLSKTVQENDLANLLYLEMVIKESFRLYPVVPLLVPHESMEECIVNGYLIPKKSRVLVNTWAIGRDPEVWSDNGDVFYPERFEGINMDYISRNFQLLPFGHGRRGCPGMQLGLMMVRIVVAQLVHCFEWEMPKGKLPHEVDMTEKFGLSMHPANNLFALPTYRLNV